MHNGFLGFNLDFEIDGTNHELEVDERGRVVGSEIDLPVSDLPATVLSSIQTTFPKAPIIDAEQNQNEGTPMYYEVHIRPDGRLQELHVTADGHITRAFFDCPHSGR
jgi:hypothetical protein